jgi:hypothetical protein
LRILEESVCFFRAEYPWEYLLAALAAREWSNALILLKTLVDLIRVRPTPRNAAGGGGFGALRHQHVQQQQQQQQQPLMTTTILRGKH